MKEATNSITRADAPHSAIAKLRRDMDFNIMCLWTKEDHLLGAAVEVSFFWYNHGSRTPISWDITLIASYSHGHISTYLHLKVELLTAFPRWGTPIMFRPTKETLGRQQESSASCITTQTKTRLWVINRKGCWPQTKQGVSSAVRQVPLDGQTSLELLPPNKGVEATRHWTKHPNRSKKHHFPWENSDPCLECDRYWGVWKHD